MHDHRRLRVWQAARALAIDIFALTESFPPAERYGITAQLRRAAVSIPSNIAEGAGRGGASFRQFLAYAADSAAELDAQLDIAQELGFAEAPAIAEAMAANDSIRKMLWVLIERAGSAPS